MEIKDISANKGNIDVVIEIVQKEEPRVFEKFGKAGKVCTAKAKDVSGTITLTLWNDDIDKVNIGDKVHLQNGWCSEYRGEKQLSAGKFGKIEVLSAENLQSLNSASSSSLKKSSSKKEAVASSSLFDDDEEDDFDAEEELEDELEEEIM